MNILKTLRTLKRLERSLKSPKGIMRLLESLEFPRGTTRDELFYDNNYTDHYYDIINRYQTRRYRGPGEWHHIIPRSMGGTDNKENLVKVPYKTHLYLHKLLPKMCVHSKHRNSMIHAISEMNKDKRYRE